MSTIITLKSKRNGNGTGTRPNNNNSYILLSVRLTLSRSRCLAAVGTATAATTTILLLHKWCGKLMNEKTDFKHSFTYVQKFTNAMKRSTAIHHKERKNKIVHIIFYFCSSGKKKTNRMKTVRFEAYNEENTQITQTPRTQTLARDQTLIFFLFSRSHTYDLWWLSTDFLYLGRSSSLDQ